MTKMVTYKNDLNTIPLKNFNPKEMDLFFAICSKVKDENTNIISFDFDELRELSDYKLTAIEPFIADLENVYTKLIELNFRVENDETITRFVLFTRYRIDKINQTVSIKTNEEFQYILNGLTGNFTKFELIEFTSLVSKYSKLVYKLLKQFRQTGYFKIKVDEFRRILDIPKSYQMSDIDKRVFKSVEKELPQYFENLKVNKLHGKGKRKRNIDYIEITFKPQFDYDEKGVKIFRKDDGSYYEKNMNDGLTQEEMDKTFSIKK